ncbi:MAG: hypothetical protein ACPGR8_15685 [Limisphaerales bacterium]
MILGHGKKVETAALGGKSNTLPGEAATGSLAKRRRRRSSGLIFCS